MRASRCPRLPACVPSSPEAQARPVLSLLFGHLSVIRLVVVGLLALPVVGPTALADDYYDRQQASPRAYASRLSPGQAKNGTLVRRDPIALQLANGDRSLLVAGAGSGSVQRLDLAGGKVVDELAVGERLSALASMADGRWVFATDETGHALALIDGSGKKLRLAARVEVPRYPVGLTVDAARGKVYVGSLWSRRLAVVAADLQADPPRLRVEQVIDLPFAPRRLLLTNAGARLLIADAFAGRFAMFDTQAGKVEQVRELPAHHIRGLTLSSDGERVLVAHQILNDLAETTHNDVHWGVLMANVLRWIPLGGILDSTSPILAKSHVHLTGDNTSAGGDPAEVAITADGCAVVALSGVNQVGIGYETDFTLRRVMVGQRPTAVTISANGKTAYVANTFDDTISVVDIERGEVERTLSLGARRSASEAEIGELLFYDARIALDGWFSCHSCHTDGQSNGFLADTRGDHSFGAAKRVLPLGDVTHTGPWGWTGKQPSLTEQIGRSVESTMQGVPLADEDVAALVAYLKTIQPAPSLAAARDEADPVAIAAGQSIFQAQGCVNCHQAGRYTSGEAYDVGLADKLGNKQFNPPSLRGVSQRDALFHDNRAASLEEVLVKFQHQLPEPLAEEELRHLLAFLRSL